eukprot:scaffold2113_cov233-Pinguiococcus_pyrenoidosus.AAC.17
MTTPPPPPPPLLTMRICLVLLLAAAAHGFRASRRVPLQMSLDGSRRQASSAAALGALSVLMGPQLVAAAVGEGDLPEGARRFNNVLRAQKTWAELGDAVSKRGSEFDDKEWVNVQQVLRAVYQVGDDMKAIAKGNSNEKVAAHGPLEP